MQRNLYSDVFALVCVIQQLVKLPSNLNAVHWLYSRVNETILISAMHEALRLNVLLERNTPFSTTIKGNGFPIFRRPNFDKMEGTQLSNIESDATLFGTFYFANQVRGGDIAVYFVHKNQPFPPSVSQFEEMRFAIKSDLLSFFGVPD